MKQISVVVAMMFSICGLVLQVPLHLRAQEPKVIEITAKRFAFSPNEIILKKGETVKLKIVSEDVTHGLYLKPLKIDADIQPGKTTELMVTPQSTGKFTAICDHFCGVNHGNMKMTVVVEE
jgi:cytochrome c oxidase subunit 2